MPNFRRTASTYFSDGFRPFFSGAAIWALASMVLWLSVWVAGLPLDLSPDPISWHAHAFLFGYLYAVLAGFLLTAVPSWTKRPAITGRPLAALFGAWLVGRLAVLSGGFLPLPLVMGLELVMPVALAGFVARDVFVSGNRRNRIMVLLLALMIFGDCLYWVDAARGDYAASGLGFRIALAASVVMITTIGGRIVPAFTRNWLKSRSVQANIPEWDRIDLAAQALLALSLGLWVILPETVLTGGALVVAGLAHLVRQLRWKWAHVAAEPLVWILHLAYLFVPLGTVTVGLAQMTTFDPVAAQHLWMSGAIGAMTLALMTRATLGHSGSPLKASATTTAVFCLITLATVFRFAVGLSPFSAPLLYGASGAMWMSAFAAYLWQYLPLQVASKAEA